MRNFVDRAVALGATEALAMQTGSALQAHEQENDRGPSMALERPFKAIRDEWIDHLEREYLGGMLARHDRNIAAVAAEAGLDRTYIYQLIRRHGL